MLIIVNVFLTMEDQIVLKSILVAAVAATSFAGAASAATLTGTFDVFVVNAQGLNSNQSQATQADIGAAA